jgi:hypothetical protein
VSPQFDLTLDLTEFEAAATSLENRLDVLGVTEQSLLDAVAQVRARMLSEVYGLEPTERLPLEESIAA